MATVTGLTADKADEIHDQTLIGATVDSSSGHLLLETMGGAVIDAGLVRGTTVRKWSPSTSFAVGDTTTYAGRLYRAASNNLNKVPGLDASAWTFVGGAPGTQMIEVDPTFERSTFAEHWETFWKNGSPAPTVSYTTTAGEIGTGRRALKVFLPASSSQRLYQKAENLVAGGETIAVRVRVKKLAASTGFTLNATLIQNDTAGAPEPLASGASYVGADVTDVNVATTYTTYEFRFTAVAGKPRATVTIDLAQSSAGTSTVVIDSIRLLRNEPALDTQWQTITVSTPEITGTLQYRRKNDHISTRMNLALAGNLAVPISGNISDITLGVLPVGFRPGGNGMSATHYFSVDASGIIAHVGIYAGGTVSITNVESRGVAYTLNTGTVIQGGSPDYLINS